MPSSRPRLLAEPLLFPKRRFAAELGVLAQGVPARAALANVRGPDGGDVTWPEAVVDFPPRLPLLPSLFLAAFPVLVSGVLEEEPLCCPPDCALGANMPSSLDLCPSTVVYASSSFAELQSLSEAASCAIWAVWVVL